MEALNSSMEIPMLEPLKMDSCRERGRINGKMDLYMKVKSPRIPLQDKGN
jgi:hypothetical protein